MRVIMLGSGHRGTGKSFLTAHLGLALARLGINTYVADFDFRSADLHLMLGVFDACQRNLRDYLDGRCHSLLDVTRPAPGSEHLRIVPASDETIRASSFDAETVQRIRKDLSELPGDIVLVDLEAGIDNSLIDLFLMGDDQWVVARREPESLKQAAGLLRRARLRLATRGPGAGSVTRPRVYTSLDDLVRDMSALKAESDGLEGAMGRRALLLNRCRADAPGDPDQWLEGLLDAGDEAGSLPVIAEVPEDRRTPTGLDSVPAVARARDAGPAVRSIRQLAEAVAADVKGRVSRPELSALTQPIPV